MPPSQVREEAAAVAVHCGAELSVTALAGEGHAAARRAAVSSAGQVVVATPGRIAQVGGGVAPGRAARLPPAIVASCFWRTVCGFRTRARA